MSTDLIPLTAAEQAELDRCESDIKDGLHKAWRAIREIWSNKLWRGNFKSFESYVETRWGFDRNYAYRLIDAANLLDEVQTTGLQISNERTARAALNVPEPDRIPVLLIANKASGGHLDSGWIKDAAIVHQEIKQTGGFVDDGKGGMVEAERALVDARAERLNRQRQHIKDSIDKKYKQVRLIDYLPVVKAKIIKTSRWIVFEVENSDEAVNAMNALNSDMTNLRLSVFQRIEEDSDTDD